MQEVALQLQLLVFIIEARAGIFFGNDVLNELGFWQDYTKGIVYINSWQSY